MVVNGNIIASYCYKRILLYAKMLKDTETEETLGFVVIIFIIGGISIGGTQVSWVPLATPMAGGLTPKCPPGRILNVRQDIQHVGFFILHKLRHRKSVSLWLSLSLSKILDMMVLYNN